MTNFPSSEVHLTDEERKQFLDGVLAESSVLPLVRRYNMMRSRVEIPRMTIGTKVLKNVPEREPEAQKLQAPPVSFESLVLTSSKLVLPWTVTTEFSKGNAKAEEQIRSMMAVVASNDLEDLAFNGDERSNDALLRANDGWLLQAREVRIVTLRKRNLTKRDLAKALRTIPVKYRRKPERLRVFTDPDVFMDLTLAGGTPVEEVHVDGAKVVMGKFLFPNVALITDPDNLIFGIERDMKLRKSKGSDETYYALHMRVDFVIQNREACVKVYTETVGDIVKRFFKRFRRKA